MVQLRDGGRYRTRTGQIKTITRCMYPWIDDNGFHYMNNGRFNSHVECDDDIIAEVTEEKEESVKDWTYNVGSYYKSKSGNKWECICVHDCIAFMALCGGASRHSMIITHTNDTVYGHDGDSIIGPWIEPLAIHWEYINPYTDRIEIVEQRLVLLGGEEQYGFLSVSQADHTAPGWRKHVGETHYRDGRVERSKS